MRSLQIRCIANRVRTIRSCRKSCPPLLLPPPTATVCPNSKSIQCCFPAKPSSTTMLANFCSNPNVHRKVHPNRPLRIRDSKATKPRSVRHVRKVRSAVRLRRATWTPWPARAAAQLIPPLVLLNLLTIRLTLKTLVKTIRCDRLLRPRPNSPFRGTSRSISGGTTWWPTPARNAIRAGWTRNIRFSFCTPGKCPPSSDPSCLLPFPSPVGRSFTRLASANAYDFPDRGYPDPELFLSFFHFSFT